jgi:hypothetical protein
MSFDSGRDSLGMRIVFGKEASTEARLLRGVASIWMRLYGMVVLFGDSADTDSVACKEQGLF